MNRQYTQQTVIEREGHSPYPVDKNSYPQQNVTERIKPFPVYPAPYQQQTVTESVGTPAPYQQQTVIESVGTPAPYQQQTVTESRGYSYPSSFAYNMDELHNTIRHSNHEYFDKWYYGHNEWIPLFTGNPPSRNVKIPAYIPFPKGNLPFIETNTRLLTSNDDVRLPKSKLNSIYRSLTSELVEVRRDQQRRYGDEYERWSENGFLIVPNLITGKFEWVYLEEKERDRKLNSKDRYLGLDTNAGRQQKVASSFQVENIIFDVFPKSNVLHGYWIVRGTEGDSRVFRYHITKSTSGPDVYNIEDNGTIISASLTKKMMTNLAEISTTVREERNQNFSKFYYYGFYENKKYLIEGDSEKIVPNNENLVDNLNHILQLEGV